MRANKVTVVPQAVVRRLREPMASTNTSALELAAVSRYVLRASGKPAKKGEYTKRAITKNLGAGVDRKTGSLNEKGVKSFATSLEWLGLSAKASFEDFMRFFAQNQAKQQQKLAG